MKKLGLKKSAWVTALIPVLIFFFSLLALKTEQRQEEANGNKIVLGFAQLGAESEWRSACSTSVQNAAQEYGIQLMFDNAQQKQENQIKAIRSFIAHRVDVIAFSPIVENGWDNVLLEAQSAGIPVILVDRYVKTDLENAYVAFIGSDFAEEGRRAGRWLLKKFASRDGEIRIAELRGTEGSSPTKGRYAGFREALDGEKKFVIACSYKGDFMRSKGKETMETILDEQPRIDVLFAHNDDMALGAVEAMEERGVVPGRDIVIISVDAQKSALELLGRGKVNCLVECSPYIGRQLMRMVQKLAAGEPVPERTPTEEKMYTEDDDPRTLPVRPY